MEHKSLAVTFSSIVYPSLCTLTSFHATLSLSSDLYPSLPPICHAFPLRRAGRAIGGGDAHGGSDERHQSLSFGYPRMAQAPRTGSEDVIPSTSYHCIVPPSSARLLSHRKTSHVAQSAPAEGLHLWALLILS